MGTQWELQTDLSEQLHTFLRDNNWLVRLMKLRAIPFVMPSGAWQTVDAPSIPCGAYEGSYTGAFIRAGV